MVTILVADGHDAVRRAVRGLLAMQPGWRVVGEASTGPEAVALAVRLHPNVVVLDLALPGLAGLEVARRIREALPATEVLVLTAGLGERERDEALLAGGRGYLLKTDTAEQLVAAVAAVGEHRPHFTDDLPAKPLDADVREAAPPGQLRDDAVLRPREREIVRLLSEGRGNQEVADALGMTVETAEVQRAAIMRKLGVNSLADLVRYTNRNRPIEPLA